jgi:TrpR-related protein YerC/YecD
MNNHSHPLPVRSYNNLYAILAKVNDSKSIESFLKDLCTPQELEVLASRWEVVLLLEQGLSYRKIHEKCGASLATITRVAKSLKYGTGGYQDFYKSMNI